jgi:pimeloyl-ACP methyl ester carboxylesterase
MLVDLIQVQTRDGVRLDGAYQAPPGAGAPPCAFVLLHGTGGNFYSSTLLEALAERLLALGCGVVRANTRGHDLMSVASFRTPTSQGGRRQGAAYELVDDCRHDVAAWVDWLAGHVGPRVGLLGHSLGAVKALYAQAREPQAAVRCVVGLSPPRLSHSWFLSGEDGPAFLETLRRAEGLVAAGQPEALLEVQFPLPFVVTAAGYVEKYGPDERYNFLRFAPDLSCPALLAFGALEVEHHAAFRAAPDELRSLMHGRSHVDVQVVTGGDHFYTGVRGELLARLETWLRTTLPDLG